MKKFTFKLEKLLSYREHMLEKEKNILAALRGQMRALEEKKESLKAEKARYTMKIKLGAERGILAGEVRMLHFQIENIEHQLKRLDFDIHQLSIRIENQLALVVEMSKDKKGLEILKEKKLEEFTAEAEKATLEEMAEFVSNSVARQQRAQ